MRLHFGSPQDGHLYIFSEGPPRNGEVPPLNVLFPSPTANDGSSLVLSSQTVDIPKQSWFQFDKEEGTEKIWLVWSADSVPELEVVKAFANPEHRGMIGDASLNNAVKEFLKLHSISKPVLERDGDKKVARVSADGAILVHAINLEHH